MNEPFKFIGTVIKITKENVFLVNKKKIGVLDSYQEITVPRNSILSPLSEGDITYGHVYKLDENRSKRDFNNQYFNLKQIYP